MDKKKNKNQIEIEQTEPGQDPNLEPGQDQKEKIDDLFGIEGALSDSVKYYFYRIGKDLKHKYCGKMIPPVDMDMIAENFGGGDFVVLARKPGGEIFKRKEISIDPDMYPAIEDQTNHNTGEDPELKFLEKMARYKEIFGSGSNEKITEQITGLIGGIAQMETLLSSTIATSIATQMKFIQEMKSGTDNNDIVSKIGDVLKNIFEKKN